MLPRFLITLFFILGLPLPYTAQTVQLRYAPPVDFPAPVDSNSPAYWIGDTLYIFNSIGMPERSDGYDQFTLGDSIASQLDNRLRTPLWIEAVWLDDDNTLYAWYHHEPVGLCGSASSLTAPQIGALVSHDGGASFTDLGIILESGDPIDCSSQNGYFAGGNGDFSVLLDSGRNYFYFLFSNYGGDVSRQGVAIARMPFDRRRNPVGSVAKYANGAWNEPGLGGAVSPILPASVSWFRADADAFWGPSIHWNSYLGAYCMLLNRSCCSPGWPQEGIYISFNRDLADPSGWSAPQKILDSTGWYPQVLGLAPPETDKLAGRVARLYVTGHSDWEIVFGE